MIRIPGGASDYRFATYIATIFGIAMYRLRDAPETIERYDENFWRNGDEGALFDLNSFFRLINTAPDFVGFGRRF